MSLTITQKRCNSSNYKDASRTKDDIKYLVIHYTGNNGDTAEGNGNYFANNEDLNASAHYFCDEDSIVQSVPDADIAWHCGKDYSGGTAAYWGKCTNANSIGIEVCMLDSSGSVRQESIDMAAKLTKQLMSTYGIAADHVIRHYDVCHKDCPAPLVSSSARWAAFKTALTATTTTSSSSTSSTTTTTTNTTTTDEEDDDNMTRYNKLTDIPNTYGFRTIINTLMTAGIINGDGSDSTGNGDVINLSEDMVKSFVINYRGGAYDRKLKAMGMATVVSD